MVSERERDVRFIFEKMRDGGWWVDTKGILIRIGDRAVFYRGSDEGTTR